MSENPMSSFRIRTMLGFVAFVVMAYFLSDALAGRPVEKMRGRGIEREVDALAFPDRREFAGAQLHALAGGLQVHDAAVAEVLDELPARRNAGRTQAQIASL